MMEEEKYEPKDPKDIDAECAICMLVMVRPTLLPCQHCYC